MENRTQSPDVPTWSALLIEAVNKPGLIMQAYSAFWSYSIGNQLLALLQCHMRGLQPGPLATFPKWKSLGRYVKRGERALTLCMPVTCKRRDDESDEESEEKSFTAFINRARWFVLSQTEGEDLGPVIIPEWDVEQALVMLSIERIAFASTDGNRQGYARQRQIAINPVAQLPYKTLFHEMAHITLGHTTEAYFTDPELTPRSLREIEAEAVALVCCESLGLEGAEYCRGYIQNWLCQKGDIDENVIPEKSAQKILRAADQILRAGRAAVDECQEPE
jgi:antirestriction protein ArdC